jgi:hypothetical protein
MLESANIDINMKELKVGLLYVSQNGLEALEILFLGFFVLSTQLTCI